MSEKIYVIYVAGPYRGPDNYAIHRNICDAEKWALKLWQAGLAVICPHLNTAHFQGAAPDHIWLDGDLELMRRCDAVFMVPGWNRSTGATVEHGEAARLGMPIFYEDDLQDDHQTLQDKIVHHYRVFGERSVEDPRDAVR